MKSPLQVLLPAVCLFYSACKDEVTPPPPPHVSTVQVSVEDVAVTEVWMRLRFTDAAQPRSYALRRDNVLIATGALTGADTLLADTTTSPGHTYSYKGLRLTGTVPTDSSSALQVTTLDTTSHVFSSIRIDTLGNISPSALYDVVILSDTNIWAVGEIYRHGPTFDTLYNFARWDGNAWRIQQIPYYFQGQPLYGPIRWVFALNDHDIWLGNSTHWDGQQFHNVDIGASIFVGVGSNKMWGSANGELYVVGNGGTIAYSPNRGSTWTRLESGTQVSINDIWGVVDLATGKRTILCAASNTLQGGERKILSIGDQNSVDIIPWPIQRELQSLWFQAMGRLYTCGDGVFVRRPDKIWVEQRGILEYTSRIRGIQQNNLVVVGGFGLISHCNGISWQGYPEANAALAYTSVAYDGNLLVAVGGTSTRAVVVQMRR